ncbi:MAG: hypothetical protein IJU83_02640 [Clostridia bacterium]|nr:hypothetical protein [Clostridia bacterium]
MDKFGIFNLLGSLMGLSGNATDANGTAYAKPDEGKKDDFSREISAESRAKMPPLQSAMLATMQSHENFVKRVRAKNGK